ncbi:chemotaxis protein CheW [Noviherbaspirillum sedimenti]|uniref:Chemotaxis protein CheW n=1 Tax=Noviherbaspirillum sedimenti TaxID=2320865 RepID=A0A3A3GAJ9_9BURK|nr:chemotaxis protein CheW [Noviherbaspirillum sedimenti]RJG03789.1 chemotaxis protein CheW [Noviherbaspirillum sedimenti]
MNVLEKQGSPSPAACLPDIEAPTENIAKITAAARVTAPEAKAAATAAPVEAAAASAELFGSFILGDEEFALSARDIREVVNVPEKLTAIPLSPAFLEGIFTLRGSVIPVLNLGKIFDAAAPAADRSQKIAIVDHDQVQVGILFHDTGEILRVRPEQRCQLHYKNPAIHGVIAGTIRLDDGARLLQILDPAALISIENVPQILALKSAGREEKSSHFHRQAERRQCVSFRVRGTPFAFEMKAIQEIISVPELKGSVLNSNLCIGRINLRGNAVAIVDFARLLNFPDAGEPASAEQRIVIARIGDAAIGLLVDSVDNIFSFFPGDLLPVPLLSKTRAAMFVGCIHKQGMGEVLFLNHEAIFSQAEILDITKGHTNLYRQEALADDSPSRKGGGNLHRQVYITFSLGHSCAVEIKQIREIIDFPSDVLKPPGLPQFVYGILNLRRQMITLIDLRSLYRMPPATDRSDIKILVVERGDERYGLMVDAVENIVTVSDRDRISTPKIMRSRANADMRSEMQEIIDIAADDNARQTFSVFYIDIFLERLLLEMAIA